LEAYFLIVGEKSALIRSIRVIRVPSHIIIILKKLNPNMKRLTKAEEEIMHIIWRLERCMVSDILNDLGDPKPPHSSISSIVRILEKKEFLDHKAYGRTYEYFPIIEKDDYSKFTLKKIASDYFEGSMNQLVSFLVKENDVDVKELGELLDKLSDEK